MGYKNCSISQRYFQVYPNGCRAQLVGENPVDLAAAFLQKLLQQSTLKQQSAISPGTLFLTIDGAFALFCF